VVEPSEGDDGSISYLTPPVAGASPLPIVVESGEEGEEEEGENDENRRPDHPESCPPLEEIPENEVPLPVLPPSSSTRTANAVSVTCCIRTLGRFKKPAPYWIKTGMARVRDNTRGRHRKVYGRRVYVVDPELSASGRGPIIDDRSSSSSGSEFEWGWASDSNDPQWAAPCVGSPSLVHRGDSNGERVS
jgi:hypothetical protein